MSKQLLHTYQSSVVIAGLNDHAFALIKGNNNDNNGREPTTNVYELMVAKSSNVDGDIEGTSEQPQQKKKKKKMSPKLNDATTAQEASYTSSNNPNEIQSVCCTLINNMIWLAVSREDKSLSLYNISESEEKSTEGVDNISNNREEDGNNSIGVYPNIVYKLPKRARCLAFSSVSSQSSSNNNECHVIIVGDLSGDAIAFPIPQVTTTPSTTSDQTKSISPTTNTKRKLLLGHTASMLTALNVVPTTTTSCPNNNNNNNNPQQQQLILTADRDEKIRISYFPQTYNVHGYLLGHSSFISTMDARSSSSNRALCVTGSGDGTVRLWDYENCKEIGMLPVVIKKCTTITAEEEEEDCEDNVEEDNDVNDDEMNNNKEEQRKVGEEEEEDNEHELSENDEEEEEGLDSHMIAVPLSVSISPNGRNVVVARDGISSIDIHPIPTPPPPPKMSSSSTTTTNPYASLMTSHHNNMVSLHKKQTLDCPTQPLAVNCLSDGSVLVLTKEPKYLLHYHQCNNNNNKAAKNDTTMDDEFFFEDISSTSSLCTSLQKAILNNSTTNNENGGIIMPNTTMEKDVNGKEWKLQKNKVNNNNNSNVTAEDEECVEAGGLHWNDAGRKETAKLAQQRRRKRRKENMMNGGKKEKKDVE